MKKLWLFIILLMTSCKDINSSLYQDPVDNKDESYEIFSTNIEKEKVNVYLNPSVQTHNVYYNNLGNEAEHMNNIVHFMKQELSNFDWINLKVNDNYLPLKESVKESNEFKADIHLALHSNAGGGRGIEVLTIDSREFASTMYEGLFKLGDFNRRGIKDGSHIYEIKNSTAFDVALLEILFHDSEEAQFIVNNELEIAKNLSESLINYIINNY